MSGSAILSAMMQGMPRVMSARASAVMPAMQNAVDRTGVHFGLLMNVARLESGFDADAKARTSSAAGLFQFIDSTWLGTLQKHGAKHGLQPQSRAEALALRNDPVAASLMAAELMADNAASLESKLGRPAQAAEVYLAHFLGAGGAAGFLKAMGRNPGDPAADHFPAAARSNQSIFYAGGAPRTLGEVYRLMEDRLGMGEQATPAQPQDPLPFPGSTISQLAAFAQAGAVDVESDPLFPQPQPHSLPPAAAARLAYLMLAQFGG